MEHLPSFAPPHFQQDLEESYQEEVNPQGDVSQGPIEFNISGNGDYIDLKATTLLVTARIVKADNTSYPAETPSAKQEVAFTNNTLHSLFADIIVMINETIVQGGEQVYALKSLISTLFTYSEASMEKQLFSEGFVKDQAGKLDDVTNGGYVVRKSWTAGGASKDFYGKLFIDLFQQSKYMFGNVDMRIKLIRAAHSSALWCNVSGEKPKFIIERAVLFLKRIRIHPQIVNEINNSLLRGAMLHYPINRTEVVMIPIPANTLDVSREQLFYGRVPKILVMAMIDSETVSGVYGKNLFNFKHNNIRHVDLRLNGMSKPTLPLTPDFVKGKSSCVREYISLLEAMNIHAKDAYLPFTYDDYLNGYTFFAWNLTPDGEGQVQNPKRRANIRLDCKFATSTTTGINIILYCLFDSLVMIDGNGIVHTDFKD